MWWTHIKRIGLLVLVIGCVVGASMLLRPLADERRSLEKHRNAYQQDNDNMSSEIALLKKKQAMFTNDPDFVEQVSRRENRIRSNEIVFVFPRETIVEADIN